MKVLPDSPTTKDKLSELVFCYGHSTEVVYKVQFDGRCCRYARFELVQR